MARTTTPATTPATDVTPAPAKAKAPVTCGAWVAANPDHEAAKDRLVTCKRLPRHKGECRVTRKAARPAKPATDGTPKAAPKGRRMTAAAKRREAKRMIATLVEAGVMTPDQALAAVAALA